MIVCSTCLRKLIQGVTYYSQWPRQMALWRGPGRCPNLSRTLLTAGEVLRCLKLNAGVSGLSWASPALHLCSDILPLGGTSATVLDGQRLFLYSAVVLISTATCIRLLVLPRIVNVPISSLFGIPSFHHILHFWDPVGCVCRTNSRQRIPELPHTYF